MTSQRNKSPEKGAKKKVNKIDEHIEQAGIDNLESFTDPQTNVIYYRLKVLGKGGFAKGNFCHFDQNHKSKKYLSIQMSPWGAVQTDRCRSGVESHPQIANREIIATHEN